MKIAFFNLKYYCLIILCTVLSFSISHLAKSQSESEDDPCGCEVTAITNTLGFYQLDVDFDTALCGAIEKGYLHFNYPDIYLNEDSFWHCANSLYSFRHRISFQLYSTAPHNTIYLSTSPPPDSLCFTDLLTQWDSTFFDWLCIGTKDSIILHYSWIDAAAGGNYDSCAVSKSIVFTCPSETTLSPILYINPDDTSCQDILLYTNYSGNNTSTILWYENAIQSSNFIGESPTWTYDYQFDGTTFGVIYDTNLVSCTHAIDTVSSNILSMGFEITITASSSTSFDCSNPTSQLFFPDLYFADSAQFPNYTYQWYRRENGISSAISGETNARLREVDEDAQYALQATDTTTSCSDVSNYITVSGISEEHYSLSIDGGNQLCLGGDSPELGFTPPLPFPFPTSATITVFDDGVSQTNDLSINSEGYYYVEIEYAGGCKPYSDSLLVDIDTIICDSGFVVSPNNFICINDPVAMINRGPKIDSIVYNWTFQGGTPSTYQGYYPPLVNFSSSGNFTITLIMNSSVSIDTFTQEITVNESCCDHTYSTYSTATFTNSNLGQANKATTYSGGGVLSGQYHVLGTIVLKNGTYTVNDGSTFYIDPDCSNCDEISQINETCRIFDYSDVTQIILQNATLNIGDAEFRSTCENMWYGISAFEGSTISSLNDTSGKNALIMDAMAGILICDPEYENNDFYQLDQITFTNNVIGFAELDRSTAVFNYLRNAHIDVDSSLMKSPYSSKLGLFGIQLEAQYHYEYFDKNFIANQHYGYYSDWIGDPNNSYRIKNNTIRDFQIAGIALGGSSVQSEVINNEFYFPDYHLGSVSSPLTLYSGIESIFISGIYPSESGPFEGFTIDEDEIVGAMLFGKQHFYNNKFYGLDSLSSTLKQSGAYLGVLFGSYPNDINLSFNYFKNLTNGIQDVFAHSLLGNNEFIRNEVGLRLPSSSTANDYIVEQNIFKENGCAIQVVNFERELSLQDNLFLDNDTSISVLHDDNTNPLDMVINCNKFQLDNVETYDRYGLFVHNGADIWTIGGDGQAGINPAGNGWPVDSSTSTGYSNCITGSGSPLNLNAWNAPDDWYVIFDENTNPTWKYWAWQNEFADESSTVYPSNVLFDRTGTNIPIGECTVWDICFPLQRVLNIFSGIENVDLKVYPNPAKNTVKVNIEDVELIRLISADLKVFFPNFNINRGNTEINLSNMVSGSYVVIITNERGKNFVSKLIIH